MNAVNAVPLLILVWTFTAVCQDADDFSVICEDVTGTVGEEVNLNCSVSLSQECTGRCIKKYKFYYPEGDSVICKEFPLGSCEQRNSFTCRFTPTTAMTGQFRFFVQTQHEMKTTGFTVNITEPIKPGPLKEDPEAPLTTREVTSLLKENDPESTTGEESRLLKGNDPESTTRKSNPVISFVAGGFIIILIIITMTNIFKRRSKYQPQWIPVCLGRRHDEDNSNCPVNVV